MTGHIEQHDNHSNYRLAMAALFSMGAVYFFSYFLRTGIPGTIFNEIQADMAMSASEVTSLGSIFILVYALMQLFVGVAADRFGGGRTLIFGGIFMGIGAILFPLSRTAPMLYMTRAITGFGASFMYLSIVKEADRLFGPRHFPVAIGITLAFGYAGGIAAMLPFERVVAAMGWRHTLLGAGILAIATSMLATVILHRADPCPPRGRPVSIKPLLEVFMNPCIRPVFILNLINFPVYFVIQTTLGKKFLEDYAGISAPAAATFTMIMTITSVTAVMFGGMLPAIFRNRRKPALVASSSVILAGTIILTCGTAMNGPPWLFLSAYVMLALQSAAGPALIATSKELNAPGNAAVAVAAGNSLSYLGVALFAFASGLVLDAFSHNAVIVNGHLVYPARAYFVIFSWLTVMAVISTAASLMIRETHGMNIHETRK